MRRKVYTLKNGEVIRSGDKVKILMDDEQYTGIFLRTVRMKLLFMKIKIPVLKREDGKIVYGFQCWWKLDK